MLTLTKERGMKARQRKTSDGKMVGRSVQLPAEVDAKLVKLSESQGVSLSYLMARAVKEFVERAEKAK